MSVLAGRPRPPLQGQRPPLQGRVGDADPTGARCAPQLRGRARGTGPRHRRRPVVEQRLIPACMLSALVALVGLTVWVLISAGHAT